jgi:hypothetical protein
MTEDDAYKILAVQNLGGFGWSITVDDMVDMQTVDAVFNRLLAWWNGLDQDTRDIITDADLTLGLWNKGWLTEWPALYTMLSGNPFGRYKETIQNIWSCLKNAKERAPDYAAQHAIEPLASDPVLQGELPQQ